NLLTNSRQLYKVAAETLEALTLSPDLGSVPSLVGLARSLQDVSADDITAITAPVMDYAPDPNRVQLTAEAEEVWAAIAADEPLPAGVDQNEYGEDAPSGVIAQDPAAP